MAHELPERDWKYLRSIQKDLLNDLCWRINQKAAGIVSSKTESEHDKYLKLYRHIEASNNIIAECFDDWSRSKLWLRLISMCNHKLLSAEHIMHLSEECRVRLEILYSNDCE